MIFFFFKERTCATVKSQRHGRAGCTIGVPVSAVRHSLHVGETRNLHRARRLQQPPSGGGGGGAVTTSCPGACVRGSGSNVTAACVCMCVYVCVCVLGKKLGRFRALSRGFNSSRLLRAACVANSGRAAPVDVFVCHPGLHFLMRCM